MVKIALAAESAKSGSFSTTSYGNFLAGNARHRMRAEEVLGMPAQTSVATASSPRATTRQGKVITCGLAISPSANSKRDHT